MSYHRDLLSPCVCCYIVAKDGGELLHPLAERLLRRRDLPSCHQGLHGSDGACVTYGGLYLPGILVGSGEATDSQETMLCFFICLQGVKAETYSVRVLSAVLRCLTYVRSFNNRPAN